MASRIANNSLKDLNTRRLFLIALLGLFSVRVLWGIWNSLDWPSVVDEWWAILDGYKIAGGDLDLGFALWDSPLWRISYAFVILAFKSFDTAFYAQRVVYTILAVFTVYYLLSRLLPEGFAWMGAAWFAASPSLLWLTWDRTDFLAAEICAWASVAVMNHKSARRMIAAVFLALLAFLFRPEGILFFFAVILYWGSIAAYRWSSQHLPDIPRWKRVAFLSLGISFAFIIGGTIGIAVLNKNDRVGSYLVWVFANNRRMYRQSVQPDFYMPLWDYYEKDFGSEKTILNILSKPSSLARDMVHNTNSLFNWSQDFLLTSTWGTLQISRNSLLFAFLLLAAWASARIYLDWDRRWKQWFHQHGSECMNMLCLFPSMLVLVFFWVPPVQALYLAPIVLAIVLFILFVLLWPANYSRHLLPLLAAALIILAPTPFRAPGLQRIRPMLHLIQSEVQSQKLVSILGNLSENACSYLRVVDKKDCYSQVWDSHTGDATLYGYLQERAYDYIIYDFTMGHSLNDHSGLNGLLSGEDPSWALIGEYYDIKIFKAAEVSPE